MPARGPTDDSPSSVPQARHKQLVRRLGMEKSMLETHTIDICSPCHKTIHAHLSEKELAESFHTIEALLAHEEIRRFVDWVATQPDRHITVRGPRDR